jgi:hypothetical protein
MMLYIYYQMKTASPILFASVMVLDHPYEAGGVSDIIILSIISDLTIVGRFRVFT